MTQIVSIFSTYSLYADFKYTKFFICREACLEPKNRSGLYLKA